MDQPISGKVFLIISSVILMCLFAVAGFGSNGTITKTISSDEIIDKFRKPDVDSKAMARMWFPDAGAGADKEGLSLVAKQINDLAGGGFGGVEVAFLSDSTSYNNDDAKTIGWGSENWRRILKEALQTANAVKDGFKIDITITSHWPPIVNNIDPNDDEASQETQYAYKKISADDMSAGITDLPLAEQRTEDYFSPMGNGADAKADFLFVQKFITATVAKVVKVDSNGSPVLELASLTDVSGGTARKTVSDDEAGQGHSYKEINGVRYAGYAGGIPDKAYASAKGLDYDKDIIAKFGPDPVSAKFAGKIDPNGSRRRMADWQYLYQTKLDKIKILEGYKPNSGDTLAAGDYVLIGSYYRGTGQVMSGGTSITIYNRSYATDYFSDKGIEKVFEFWNKHIMDDEMLALLKENGARNGSSIFEDSIEIHAETTMWTYDLLKEFMKYNGYDAAKYAPVLIIQSAGGERSQPGPAGQFPVAPSFDDTAKAVRIKEDYNLLMGYLYARKHASVISKWAAGFNYTYRAQGYALPGLDIAGAAAAIGIPEGDNGSTGDGVRNLVAAVNMKDGKILSMESTTFSASMTSTWAEVIKELNRDFSIGVNRSILHGSAFSRSFNRYGSEWPGWNFWGFSSWNSRQIYWDDVDTFSNYVARNQALMQNGRPQVDLAILLGTESSFDMQRGNSMQTLLDKGYSYNLLSEALLKLDSAKVKNGILCPAGPAYRALILKDAKILSASTIKILLEYSKNGLPIIFYNCDIKRVYGTNKADDNDSLLEDRMAELMQMKNISTAKSQDEITKILAGWGIDPAASYSAPNLETTHRADAKADYYYFYNNSENNSIETTLALTGDGSPYRLDAWTGEVIPLALYIKDNNRINVTIELEPREAVIIAISEDMTQFPKVKGTYVTSISGGDALFDKESIVHRAQSAGTYAVAFSDNSKKSLTIDKIPETINLTDGWDLKLESWGPDREANNVDPTLSAKKTISFGDIRLAKWTDLPITEGQLERLGVKDVINISGIGYYSKTFSLPSDWDRNIGAYIHLEHNSDMVTEVIINDKRIDDINQFTNMVDVGAYLKNGTNTLKVKLDTTLKNRVNLEKPGGVFPGGGEGGQLFNPGAPTAAPGAGGVAGADAGSEGQGAEVPPGQDTEPQQYGLTDLTLIPYFQTVLLP